jgi:hypothetical protein
MLSNKTRTILGLKVIDKKWEKLNFVKIPNHQLYISEDRIVEKIITHIDDRYYREIDCNFKVNHQNELIGKTGKVKKITASYLDKVSPKDCFLLIKNSTVLVTNNKNNLVFINKDYDDCSNIIDAHLRLVNDLSNLTKFEKEFSNRFKGPKLKKQRILSGSIFRIRLGLNSYGYGRIISDVSKLTNFSVKSVGVQTPISNENHIFYSPLNRYPTWVDFYSLTTDNPYLKLENLEEYELTPSILIAGETIRNNQYEIVDNFDLTKELDSIDVPLDYETIYNVKPLYHIFKWGLGVFKFPVNEQLLELEGIREPNNYKPKYLDQTQAIEDYLKSIEQGELSFRAISRFGDLREQIFIKSRGIISESIGFDLETPNYDSFAKQFGFLSKSETIEACK